MRRFPAIRNFTPILFRVQPHVSDMRRALEHLQIDRVAPGLDPRNILLQILPANDLVFLGVKVEPRTIGCRD